MNWDELEIGDVITMAPLGKYQLWMLRRFVGTRISVFMNMETGEMMDSFRGNHKVDDPWTVLRGGQTLQEGT